MSHPHDDQEHGRRPEFWNGISLGNVLTILGGLFVAGGLVFASGKVLADKDATDTRQDQEIAKLKGELRALNSNLVRLMVAQGVPPVQEIQP